jgi:hypothetical protein
MTQFQFATVALIVSASFTSFAGGKTAVSATHTSMLELCTTATYHVKQDANWTSGSPLPTVEALSIPTAEQLLAASSVPQQNQKYYSPVGFHANIKGTGAVTASCQMPALDTSGLCSEFQAMTIQVSSATSKNIYAQVSTMASDEAMVTNSGSTGLVNLNAPYSFSGDYSPIGDASWLNDQHGTSVPLEVSVLSTHGYMAISAGTAAALPQPGLKSFTLNVCYIYDNPIAYITGH